jgi:hypothetical protein
MKQEYKEKLDKMFWFFNNYKTIPGKDLHTIGMNNFVYPMEELALTKDKEVLECLLDFFEKQFDSDSEGVLESLESFIQCNFTSDQIIEAFYKKFDSFMNRNLWRCVHICWNSLFIEENFEKFRKMFNSVKSKHSEKFLKEMFDWAPEGEKQISILENDMKKW